LLRPLHSQSFLLASSPTASPLTLSHCSAVTVWPGCRCAQTPSHLSSLFGPPRGPRPSLQDRQRQHQQPRRHTVFATCPLVFRPYFSSPRVPSGLNIPLPFHPSPPSASTSAVLAETRSTRSQNGRTSLRSTRPLLSSFYKLMISSQPTSS
jgi:hypothetical protein